jgi:hypothetical protein
LKPNLHRLQLGQFILTLPRATRNRLRPSSSGLKR